MDLLDISLDGATISSPPGTSDPWGMTSPPPPPRPQVRLITNLYDFNYYSFNFFFLFTLFNCFSLNFSCMLFIVLTILSKLSSGKWIFSAIKLNILNFSPLILVNISNTVTNRFHFKSFTQQSDPWALTTSPPVDPWNPVQARPAPPIGGAGTSNVEHWLSRTQSPSVNSSSSAEGWLQNNGTASNSTPNGNLHNPPVDPWLSKPLAQPPAQDSWLKTSAPGPDAWGSAAGNIESKPSSAGPPDPWAPNSQTMGVISKYLTVINALLINNNFISLQSRPSPIGAQTSPNSDYDEFDVISNRAKAELQNNSSNNNNCKSMNFVSKINSLVKYVYF